MDAWVYDWEVYPNFACVSFIHLETPKVYIDAYIKIDIEYLALKDKLKYTNIIGEEGDILSLIDEKINIKNKLLDMMNVKQFTIYKDSNSKYDICQLGELLSFYISHKVLFGYNSINYDSVITDWLLIHGKKYNLKTAKNTNNIHICNDLKILSDEIVHTDKSDFFMNNYSWKPKYYKRLFTDYDIQKILYLDKTFVGLKSVAINLRWHRIQELPIYFDSIVEQNEVYTLKDYNINDILITYTLVHNQEEEIKLRDKISDRYNLNVRNDSRSSIGKKLMSKYYSDYSGLDYKDFKDLKTNRGRMSLASIITDRIYFKTDKFNKFLKELKSTIVTPSDDFSRVFEHNNTFYNIAKGGIHSIDDSSIYDMYEDNCIYKDADITSYYPSILIIFGISPNHLDKNIFLKLVGIFKDDRVKAKDAAKKIKTVIKTLDKTNPEIIAKIELLNKYIEDYTLEAEALKIVINRIYGALKDINDYLFDPKATYMTTFNGQLSLLMLIERLEEEGIHCISANTDGIVCRIGIYEVHKYLAICQQWEKETEFRLEYTDYEKYVRNNVNEYIAIKKGFKDKYNSLSEEDKKDNLKLKSLEEEYIKFKGLFIEETNFNKGFIHPIVSIALKRYIVYDINYRDTIYNHITLNPFNIYDYCISQKVDKKFDVVYIQVIQGEIIEIDLQQYNRYYVCTCNGGSILKKDEYKHKKRSQQLLAKKQIALLNDYIHKDNYNINFGYYVNKVEQYLYFKKKNPKGNHKYEGLLIRGNNLFSNEEI